MLGLFGRCLIDPSHRVWHDVKIALVASGLWPFMLLMTIVVNSDYGPWAGAMFFQKVSEYLEML